MDYMYWENYYKENRVPGAPSLFSQFVWHEIGASCDPLLELGCGNGRDALFFAGCGVNVTAFDQCDSQIEFLNRQYSCQGLKFAAQDFTKLSEIQLGLYGCIYSRFTLHSIDEQGMKDVLSGVQANTRIGGYFCCEFRGKKNELWGVGKQVPGEPDTYYFEGHNRRFVCMTALVARLEKIGFDIVYASEKPGFSPYLGENQTFARLIAKKTMLESCL